MQTLLLKTLLDAVEKVISTMCQFKKEIKAFLVSKLTPKYFKLFLETDTSKPTKPTKKPTPAPKPPAPKPPAPKPPAPKPHAPKPPAPKPPAPKPPAKPLPKPKPVVKPARKDDQNTLSKISETIKNIAAKTKQIIDGVITVLMTVWNQFSELAKTFLSSELNKQINGVFECIQGIQGRTDKIVNVAKGIVERVDKIINEGTSERVDVLIDMLCSFSKLREAGETIKQAVSSGNTLEKWNLIGRSIGKIFYSITGARKKLLKN